MKRRWSVVLVVSVLVVCTWACGDPESMMWTSEPESGGGGDVEATEPPEAAATDKPGEPTKAPEPTEVPPTTDAPTAVPTEMPPTATLNPNVIAPGTYIVGEDIQPGLYKGQAGDSPADSCYWVRLSDLSGEFDAIIANDNSIGQFYVEVAETDYAFEVHCEMVYLETLPEPPAEFPQEVGPGMYLVGIDIQAGIWRGNAGADISDSCYWVRLANLSGEFDGILANDNSIGQFYVEVAETDYAFEVHCSVARLDPLPDPPAEFPQKIAPGMYLVGIDIQPGTYKGQAGDDISDACYWARLSNVSGGFGAIIANDNAIGQYYVQVQPGDFALETKCELEWVGE